MTEMPMDIGRAPVPVGSTGAIFSCPECGSFLDTPRTDPHSGDLARKCAVLHRLVPGRRRLGATAA